MPEAPSPPPDGRPAPGHALVLPRRRIVGGLAATTALLVLASATLAVLRIEFDRNRVFGLSRFLDLDREDNLPTWFESAVFLFAAVLALAIARLEHAARRPAWSRWAALASAILLMSLDEVAAIHEHFTLPESALGAHGLIRPFTWVFAGAVVMALVAGLLLRFVLGLPARTRRGILVAGALFVGGAVGCEALGGLWSLRNGSDNLVYAAIVTIEESLEIAGAVVLVDALLGQLAAYGSLRTEVT